MENKNRYITVAYKLYTIEDGEKELVEEAPEEHPFQFISALGTTLDAFESQIASLAKGDTFDFTIPCAEAYGEYVDEHVLDLPRNMFEVDGRMDTEVIKEGNIVPLMDSEGRRLNGTVVEVKEDIVIMDMNHPLAGADLNFVGTVTENREATAEEVQGMINMLSGEGCGCGCHCDDEDGCHCDGCH
jgi:FKBP-type peptidyl-prolyl cis-trans isomerase SlyD